MPDFERSHFRQPVLGMLCQVLDEAWRELEPHVRGGKLTREQVAQRIMQSALLGERNPAQTQGRCNESRMMAMRSYLDARYRGENPLMDDLGLNARVASGSEQPSATHRDGTMQQPR